MKDLMNMLIDFYKSKTNFQEFDGCIYKANELPYMIIKRGSVNHTIKFKEKL